MKPYSKVLPEIFFCIFRDKIMFLNKAKIKIHCFIVIISDTLKHSELNRTDKTSNNHHPQPSQPLRVSDDLVCVTQLEINTQREGLR